MSMLNVKKLLKNFINSIKYQIDYVLFCTKDKILKYLKLCVYFDVDLFISLNNLLNYLVI